jgi:Cu/Ag efflux protein CusF
MKIRMLIAMSALGLLLTAGCATAPDKPPVKEEKSTAASQPAPTPDLSTRETITATATVQAIDLQTREVTLKDQKGQVFTVKVSDEVRNLPQVRVGDRVVVTYQQELAVYLTGRAGTGISTRTDTLSAGRAQPGQLPAGVVRDTARITANIISVNKQKRQVLVRGATRTVLVKVPSDFDITRFKVGEEVEAEFVQELAITVKPAPAKPARSGPGFNKRSN